MSQVNLNLDKEGLGTLLGWFKDAQKFLRDELAKVDANIKAIDDVLDPAPTVLSSYVQADSSSRTYQVKCFRPQGGTPEAPLSNAYTCECPSYRFQSGTIDGKCKHITKAIREKRFG